MSEKVEIILNGNGITIPAGWTLTQLLADLKLKPDQVAIEVNEQIVNRRLWSRQLLAPADRIEIVHFVGGGRGV